MRVAPGGTPPQLMNGVLQTRIVECPAGRKAPGKDAAQVGPVTGHTCRTNGPRLLASQPQGTTVAAIAYVQCKDGHSRPALADRRPVLSVDL